MAKKVFKTILLFCNLSKNLIMFLLFFSIIFLQTLTVYLDNKTNMYDFFVRIKQGTVANAYTNRGITLTVSRTIFFAVPPLLGYLILDSNQREIEFLILVVAFINLFLTTIQSFFYCQMLKKDFFIEIFKIRKNYLKIDFLIGILAFMFFLITPYFLNYFAIIFPSHGLWIVQLNAIVNSFLTLYVIWMYEPRIAKKIDRKNKFDDEFFEAILVRFCGRFFIFLSSIILIHFF